MSDKGNQLESVAGSQTEMTDTWSWVEVGRIQEQVKSMNILENPVTKDTVLVWLTVEEHGQCKLSMYVSMSSNFQIWVQEVKYTFILLNLT